MASKRVSSTDVDPQAWGTHYEAIYTSKSQISSKARAKRRARQTATATPLTETKLVIHDIVRSQQASKRDVIDQRLTRGFEWKGGGIAGNPEYQHDPFRFTGLKSDNHPILKLFVSKLHRAKRLRVGDTKADSSGSDSKLLALDAPYVEANKVACGVLRVEIDSTPTWSALTDACTQAGVPLPNLVVGYEDTQGRMLRPHLIWLLHVSGPLGGPSPQARKFEGLYRRVMHGLTHALLPLGADPGGLWNMHRHKNPVSPLWTHGILAEVPYHLADLAAAVDTRVTKAALNEAAASQPWRKNHGLPDHPDPEVAADSNGLFRHLATWARVEVTRLRAAGGDEQEFKALVAAEAGRSAPWLPGKLVRSERAALAMAAQVAHWTWNVYRAPKARAPSLGGEQLRERLVQGQTTAAAMRTARTRDIIRAAASQLVEQNRPVTQAAVAAIARLSGIRGEKTIRRHWDVARLVSPRPARSARKNRSFAMTDVKKEQLSLPLLLVDS